MGKIVEGHFFEGINSVRNDLKRLSFSVTHIHERQRAEQREGSSQVTPASVLKEIKEEIRKARHSMEQAQSLQNLKAELAIQHILLTDAQEHRDFSQAILAFGRFIEQRDIVMEKKVEELKNEARVATTEKAAMKFTIEQLITAIRDLLEIAKNWLLAEEV